ncbi:hypothetical protein M0804_014072 [Polistes exclamans]|nr:hypothetical protein M0804_014072 [Polistes exclamans]
MHPKTANSIIIDEVKKMNLHIIQINNITVRDTKQPLPLFFINIESNDNNKDIYEIDVLHNTIASFVPLKTKRDILKCLCCQSHEHTKNYCNKSTVCVKCAGKH